MSNTKRQPCTANIADQLAKCCKSENSSKSSSNNPRKQAGISCQEKPFKCSKCQFSCKTSSNLGSHKIVHSKEKPFKCSKCPFSCKRSDHLRRHNVIHSKEKPFKCSNCAFTCKRSQDLISHNVTHSNEKLFKCPKCPFSSKRSGNLKSHERIHSKGNPFKCSECPYSCKKPFYLRRHRIIHLEEQPFRCNICLKSFTRADGLRYHMKTHSRPSNPFKCRYCSFSSRSIQLVKRHRVLRHPQNSNEKQRTFLCTFAPCEFKTLRKSLLTLHQEKHLREEPFKCTYCSFSAPNNPFLEVHIVSCHTEKCRLTEYSCKLCDKTIGVNQLLAVHNEQVHGIPFVVLELLHI